MQKDSYDYKYKNPFHMAQEMMEDQGLGEQHLFSFSFHPEGKKKVDVDSPVLSSIFSLGWLVGKYWRALLRFIFQFPPRSFFCKWETEKRK